MYGRTRHLVPDYGRCPTCKAAFRHEQVLNPLAGNEPDVTCPNGHVIACGDVELVTAPGRSPTHFTDLAHR
jgi:hypothetical protein